MQQAYRVLRVVAQAQTIRIVLMLRPSELMLNELYSACSALHTENSSGIKAVVLDFKSVYESNPDQVAISPNVIQQATAAVRAIESPVLAVVRGSISVEASALMQGADLTLAAHNAVLPVGSMGDENNDTLMGAQALQLGYVTWSVPTNAIDAEMTRILDMLREKKRSGAASHKGEHTHRRACHSGRCRGTRGTGGTFGSAQAGRRVLSFKGNEHE